MSESRRFDAVYDPIYQVSTFHSAPRPIGATARAAQTLNATASASATQTLAATIKRPAYRPEVADSSESEVLGRSRVKFFKRPIAAFSSEPQYVEARIPAAQLPQPAINAKPRARQFKESADLESAPIVPSSAVQSATASVGVQTDYRESGSQTTPFSPDYITAPEDGELEILRLSHLTFGAGLPASLEEVKYIQKLREKAEFERNLPPVTDAKQAKIRQKLLEERELKEWQEREEEIKEEQAEQLKILVESLRERERMNDQLNEMRVNLIREAAMQERNRLFDQLNKKRIKIDRALNGKRDTVEDSIRHMALGPIDLSHSLSSNKQLNPRDIVEEYFNHGSQVYAPVTREGKIPVKNSVVDYSIPILQSHVGLQRIEANLPEELKESNSIAAPSIVLSRKQEAVAADLKFVDSLLKNPSAVRGSGPRLIENVYKKFEPVQRAPTPTIENHPDHEQLYGDSDADRAIIQLQALIRGRMIQNEMFQGREHARHLIAELRSEEKKTKEQKSAALTLSEAQQADNERLAAMDGLLGEILSGTLQFVRGELIRVTEENAISDLAMEAAQLRREREAIEAGRRQAEQIKREREEKYYEGVMAVHSRAAHQFILRQTEAAIERYSREQAEVQSEIAALQRSLIERVEDEQNTAEQIIESVLDDFLFPEVERRRELEKDRITVAAQQEAAKQAVEMVKNAMKS